MCLSVHVDGTSHLWLMVSVGNISSIKMIDQTKSESSLVSHYINDICCIVSGEHLTCCWSKAVKVMEPGPWQRVLRIVLVIFNMLYCIPSYLVWTSLLRPLLYLKPDWYYMIEGILFSWLLHFVAFWAWNAGCSGKLQVTFVNSELF